MAPTTGATHRSELRLRIEGAFSAAQLCQLADKWDLGRDPKWERSAADAAHELIKAAERRFGLLELVRQLKLERPLYEWPDLDEAALAEWGPPSVAAPSTMADLAGEATVMSGPPSGMSEAAGAPRPAAAPPPLGSPFLAATPAQGGSKPLDPTILLAVGGIVLVVGLGGLGAGIALSRRAERLQAASATPASSTSPAGIAAQVFDDALAEVAERCDMEVDGPKTKDVLAAAQSACGDLGAPKRAKRHEAYVGPDFAPTPASTHTTPAARDAPPRDAPPRVPGEPRAPGGSPCLSRCASDHGACMKGCGGEPSDASKYDSWLSCSSRCLASESRCRLACP